MEDNYDFKYKEREYEIMMLKKNLKNDAKPEDAGAEEKQEMNELVESDPELYAADADVAEPSTRRQRQKVNNKITIDDDDLFNASEISLEDPEEFRETFAIRKEQESKIHNSFTGPYPLDPTEFSHTDKGENAQFGYLKENK